MLFLFVGGLHASHRGCFEYFTLPCKVCPFYLITEQFTSKSCQNCWESSVECGFILLNDCEQSSRNGLVGVYYYYKVAVSCSFLQTSFKLFRLRCAVRKPT